MATPAIAAAIREQLDRLPLEEQYRVLGIARSLAACQQQGVFGKVLLRYVGSIDAADLTVIHQVIEEERERVHVCRTW